MSAKTQMRTRRILTPTENENFEAQIAQDKADKTEDEKFFPGAQIKPGDDDQIKNIKRTLRNGQPDTINKWEKSALEKRAAELKTYLSSHMVPRTHIGLRESSGGVQDYQFRKAVSSMAKEEMSAQFQEAAQEYKNIMRQLGRPEDANLEEIRPDSR